MILSKILTRIDSLILIVLKMRSRQIMPQKPPKGKDRVQEICDSLRQEALQPALQEAESVAENAKKKAEEILKEAQNEAEKIVQEAQKKGKKHQSVVEASLEQAAKQTLASVKQRIEKDLFNEQLAQMAAQGTKDPKILAKLIEALVKAIEKEGTSAEFSVAISEGLTVDEINKALSKKIIGRLKEKSVTLGGFGGGVQVRLHDQKLTLDVSGKVLEEILAGFVRKDFRELIFKK